MLLVQTLTEREVVASAVQSLSSDLY
jgi:hypothetical protein